MCLCSCARSACTSPPLAGVCGVGVGACARVSAAPRHSWLGCSGVCVFVCAVHLYPATPGCCLWCWCLCLGLDFCCAPPLVAGLLGYVRLCACSACTPLLLARVCGVWVGCCPAPVPVPWFVACCARCPGLRHLVAVVAWHLSVCRGFGRRRASLASLEALLCYSLPCPVRSLPVLQSASLMPW